MSAPTFSILLTPPGTGAIAVIRVIGPDSVRIVERAFRSKGATSLSQSAEGRLRYGHIVDGEELIDDVIACRVTHNDRPAVEICAHGGVRVVERILSLLEKSGAAFCESPDPALQTWSPRSAIEAEAIEAMIAAKTERALRFFAFQRERLTDHLQLLAKQCLSAPEAALREMERLLQTFPAARALLVGWTVAIIGPPNSGKSTLFNQLVGRTRAVVSPQAGTTRDWIEEQIEIDGVPIRLIDTAGQHETRDRLEGEAISAGTDIVRKADVLILVLDQSAPLPPDLRLPPGGAACILAANKSDLPTVWDSSDPGLPCDHRVRISAAQGSGIAELALLTIGISGLGEKAADRPAVFTDRQRIALDNARLALGIADCAQARNIIQQQLSVGEM